MHGALYTVYLVIILRVGENFASRCTLQVSEAALVKTEGLADKALRLGTMSMFTLHPTVQCVATNIYFLLNNRYFRELCMHIN
jgi:hypothetical protein